jgi:hypothetical protein
MNTNKYQLSLDPGTEQRILGFLDMTEEEAARFRTLISGEFATFHAKGAPHLPLTISGPLEPYTSPITGKVYDPAVKAIFDNATAWAERKKAEGWTKADFARGLKEFFEEENANAQARAAMRPGSILDHVQKRVEEKLATGKDANPYPVVALRMELEGHPAGTRGTRVDVNFTDADVEWWNVELADGVVVSGQANAFEIIQNVELVVTLKGEPTAKQAKRVTDVVGHKPVSINQSPGTGQNAIFYFIVQNENTAYGVINKINKWDFVLNCKINPSITTDKEKSNG